jgi:hypothetical protein
VGAALSDVLASGMEQIALPCLSESKWALGISSYPATIWLRGGQLHCLRTPHCFRLALVTVDGDQASPPVYVSGVDWGLPGFGDTQITKNLQQLLAAGRAPH